MSQDCLWEESKIGIMLLMQIYVSKSIIKFSTIQSSVLSNILHVMTNINLIMNLQMYAVYDMQ